jgi:pyruvate dehydrogenase E2 component (dihydrolipoamide acetyltransferase)
VPQELKLPEVGEGIESGTVVAVLVKVGDRIEVDQPLLELETDKAVVEMPSTVAGVVTKVHVQPNTEARIGQVVVTVDESAADAPAEAAEGAAQPSAAQPSAAPEATAQPSEPTEEAPGAGAGDAPPAAPQAASAPAASAVPGPSTAPVAAPAAAPLTAPAGPTNPIPAAPSVRRLAREQGIDLRAVAGSGILGRISAEDVRRFAAGEGDGAAPRTSAPSAQPSAQPTAQPTAQPLPDFSRWGETERVAMTGIRKVTVRSMTASWSTVPMVTNFDDADATDFEALRQRYKGVVEKAGAKLTPTAMLLKVVAAALRKFPDFNASIDVATQEIVYKRYVNLGVAVDTDHGLLVPVVKGADRKSVVELSVELAQLAEKARARKLTPDDMSGGNFTVSNLGGIGGTGFSPIVNQPEVAILGVSRSAMKPVWDKARGEFVPRLLMPLALTYDHRLIDGAAAARFLRWVCQAVEEPYLLTLEG